MTEEERERTKQRTGVSRREFITGTVGGVIVGAVVGAATGSLGFPKTITQTTTQTTTATTTATSTAQPWIPASWDDEADVVVCGCGAVGAPAAIDLHDAGADVLIVEAATWLGGEMRRSGGEIVGANTAVQQALGVVDTPDDLYNYYIACGGDLVDPALVRLFADNSGPNVNWMFQTLNAQPPVSEWNFATPADKGLSNGVIPGLNLGGTPNYFSKFNMTPIQRSHGFPANPADMDSTGKFPYSGFPNKGINAVDIGGGGTGLWKPFGDALTARNVRIMTSTAMTQLVATPDREVLGIQATNAGKTLYIKAKKGVILGTGGWAGNTSLMLNYTLAPPSPISCGQNAYFGSAPQCQVEAQGAGLLAAQAIGAGTMGMVINSDSGGLKINANAQVLDVFGNVIPRLYAGGRDVGGFYRTDVYPMCGTMVGTAVCAGRIAAKNVVAETPWS